jgi:hypothetical protein
MTVAEEHYRANSHDIGQKKRTRQLLFAGFEPPASVPPRLFIETAGAEIGGVR